MKDVTTPMDVLFLSLLIARPTVSYSDWYDCIHAGSEVICITI